MGNNKFSILGNKLKDLRCKFEMTQDDIAEILGMSRTSFSKYENGAANPPLNVLKKMSLIYNVRLEYLIYDDDTSVFFADGKNEEQPDLDESISTFNDLSHDEKLMIMRMRLMSAQKKEEIRKEIEDAGEN